MTDDVMNQIRDARQEAEAIAGADMDPAAMRQAVAVLEKHLAELAADAEAEQQEQHDAWEARLAADMEKANAEQQKRRADLEKMGTLEERTAKRAGELLQRLNNAMGAAGELGNHPVANRARESLEAVAAKRRRRWARDTGDDYDMASFAWVVIGLIEADRLKARAVDMVLDAIGAETGILPEESRRADIVADVKRRFASCSFGAEATREYEQFMLRYQAREDERERRDKAIGADAIAAEKQRRLEAEARAGGYITLGDVADIILKEIGPEVKNRESLKSSLSAFFNKHNLPSRPAGGHRQTLEYDRQAAGAVVERFCTRYYPPAGMMPDADRQAVREAMTAKAIERGRPKN